MYSRTRTIPIPEFDTEFRGWVILLDLYQEYNLWGKSSFSPSAMVDNILQIKKHYHKLKFYISVVDEQFAYLNWEPVVNDYDIGEL